MQSTGINRGTLSGVPASRAKSVAKSNKASLSSVRGNKTPKMYVGSSHLFNEHPRLAVEIMDAQRSFCSNEMAVNLLLEIKSHVKDMIALESSQGEVHVQKSEFNRAKFSIKRKAETEMFGRRVLKSDLTLANEGNGYVYFTIPGLNLEREKYSDEVVTLFLNGKLVSLPFNHLLDYFEQRKEVISTFGRQHMDISFLPNGDVKVGMKDEEWRVWDRTVMVSGWGFRYAEGEPVAMPVIPVEFVYQQLLSLDFGGKKNVIHLKSFVQRVEQCISMLAERVLDDVSGVEYLSRMVGSVPDSAGTMKGRFLENPRQALTMVSYAFNGPSRENVTRLLREIKF